MIFHPLVLSLLVSSLLISLMTLYAGGIGLQILLHWNLQSGSEQQLALERKTYLISTVITYLLLFQLVSLFFFIYTADALAPMFVGAMCAVGSLTADRFGYPVLLLKLGTFLLAGLWLILNHADNQGYDYPLIRQKYRLLLLLAPLLTVEAGIQTAYFLGLHPDIITSCCGSLFNAGSRSIAAEISNLPPLAMLAAFYLSLAATCAAGCFAWWKGRGQYLFAICSAAQLPVSLLAVISVISLYIYQMPSHHCPFCILQPEYHFIGYPLYCAMLTAAVTGIGVGLLQRHRTTASLQQFLPGLQHRLIGVALAAQLLVAALSTLSVVMTDFTLRTGQIVP